MGFLDSWSLKVYIVEVQEDFELNFRWYRSQVVHLQNRPRTCVLSVLANSVQHDAVYSHQGTSNLNNFRENCYRKFGIMRDLFVSLLVPIN